MTKDSSATAREPHANRTTRTATIIDALKRRAQSVLNDESIDARSRSILRNALKTNDPWLAELVRQADADKGDACGVSQTSKTNEEDSRGNKIEALAEIICRGGDESAGALFVLMGTLQNSTHPEALANTVKHFAFTRCGEFNLFGMVDDQLAAVESELLLDHTPIS